MPSARVRKAARPPRASPAAPGRGLTLSLELRAPPRCAALPSLLRAVRELPSPRSPAGSGTSRAPGAAGQGKALLPAPGIPHAALPPLQPRSRERRGALPGRRCEPGAAPLCVRRGRRARGSPTGFGLRCAVVVKGNRAPFGCWEL